MTRGARPLGIVSLLGVACSAGYFALYVLFIGAVPYGNGNPGATACILPSALPSGAQVIDYAPEIDPVPATMQVTRFPLGIVCTVRLANPERTEVIHHQSWPATIGWLGLTAVAVAAIAFAILLARKRPSGRDQVELG